METIISRKPMGRVGEAMEIAAPPAYPAADESVFTTGIAISIDGSWTL
ncbi:hypothetical protein [Chelativorans sp. YIM 93263]